MKKIIALGIFCLNFFSVKAQNLVSNASFENNPPFYFAPGDDEFQNYTPTGSTTPGAPLSITNWTVISNDVDLHNAIHWGMGCPPTPGGGQHHIDLNPVGVIRQQISLISGRRYLFSFYVSVHNQSPDPCPGGINARVDIGPSGTGSIFSTNINMTPLNRNNWQRQNFSFTAPSTALVDLTFSGTGNATACYLDGGVLIDSVVIIDSTQQEVFSNCSDACYWRVTGNNILQANRNIFGTLSNDNVRIFTNNQQRGILTNTGNFGWNTLSTPTAKFHVNAGLSLTAGIRFEGLMASQDPNILSVDPMGNVHMMPVPASGIFSACSTQNFVPKVGTTGSPNLICSQIFDNGVNVGINTTSPTAQLHQATAAATASVHKFSNATIGNLVTDGFDVGIGSTGIGEIRQKENLGMNFYTNNAQRATIDANGYIGFNQPTPLANLDIMNSQCDNRPAIKITNDYVNATCNVGVSHGNYIECVSSISPTTQFIVTDGGSVGIRCVPSTFTSGTPGIWTATTTPSQQVRLDVNGLTRSTFFATTSDAKYKTNISPLSNSLSNIIKLKGVEYNWKFSQYPNKQFDELKHSGFIAQELMEVLPNAVIKDKDGDYAVDYNSVIPVLTEAIKEQQKQIENQQAQIEELKKLVAQNGSKTSSATGIGEANKSIDGYLAQNTPNPFSNNTEIKYQLPKSAQTAMLGIYDLNGKQIRMYSINTEQNSGSITVQANDLQAGMYLYTLVVDGKAFDTKRMVLTAQ